MIQRIQTVYLLGAVILIVLCFFVPMAELAAIAGQLDSYTLNGLTKTSTGKSFGELLTFLSRVVVGVTFVSIFLYKKRKRQMRACLIAALLQLTITILVLFQLWQLKKGLGGTVTYRLPIVFPLISAVLTYLAYRGVKKDEELVRSYDRLR